MFQRAAAKTRKGGRGTDQLIVSGIGGRCRERKLAAGSSGRQCCLKYQAVLSSRTFVAASSLFTAGVCQGSAGCVLENLPHTFTSLG
jgi:hypothetical protein